MTCVRVRTELARVQDAVASMSDAAREHVAGCPACAAYADRLRAQEGQLTEAFGRARPPADLADRVIAAVLSPVATARGPVWHLYASAVAITTVVLAVVAVVTGPHRGSDTEGLGSVVIASGGVAVIRGSEVLGDVEGQRAHVGDLIVTAGNGLARLKLDDGSCLRLQSNTIVEIGSGRPVCLSLRRGGLQAFVPPTAVCAVETPSGTAVMQGAQLCLTTTGLQTDVAVREGVATFANPQGEVIASTAQYTTALVGSPPMAPSQGANYLMECGSGCLPTDRCRH